MNLENKKILILYTAHSLGHKSIAENIGYYFEKFGFKVVLVDALHVETTTSISKFLSLHLFVYRYLPFVWRWLYMWGYIPVMPLLKFFARFHWKKIWAIIEKEKPDVVISTQVSPSAVVSYLKSKKLYAGLFGIAFSDFHLHPSWLYEGADFYLANTEEQKQEMVGRGVAEDEIFVCGITVKPKPIVNTELVKAEFGIPAGSKVVLVGSGSLGIGMPDDIVDILKKEVHLAMRERGAEVRTIVVCGRNRELYENLQRVMLGSDFHILGFYEPMDSLYAIADVYISKPGGLSIIEALRWNLPVFVTHILPGQEELNLQYLTLGDLVIPLYVEPSRGWAGAILEELYSGKFRRRLEANPKSARLLNASSGEPLKGLISSMFHKKNSSK